MSRDDDLLAERAKLKLVQSEIGLDQGDKIKVGLDELGRVVIEATLPQPDASAETMKDLGDTNVVLPIEKN